MEVRFSPSIPSCSITLPLPTPSCSISFPHIASLPCHGSTRVSLTALRNRIHSFAITHIASAVSNETAPRSILALPAHLADLSSRIASDADVPSALQPWKHKLTVNDWEALIVEYGEMDCNISLEIFGFFREYVLLDRSNLLIACKDSDEKKTVDPQSNQESDAKQTSGLSSISKLYSSLVKVLARNRRLVELEKLQAQIKEDKVNPDFSFYDAMLKFYAYEGLTEKVSEVLEVMKTAGYEPHPFTNEKIAFAIIKHDPPNLGSAMQMIKDMIKTGTKVSVGLFKNLMKAYWRERNVKGAEAVLESMQLAGHTPDLKTIFKVVQLHGQNGNYERIVELMDHMNKWEIQPNSGIFDSLLNAYCKAGLMGKAKETFVKYKSVLNIKPTGVAFNMLINGYGKQGLYEEALDIFEQIPRNGYKPNVINYNLIISIMAQAEKFNKAAQLFRRMKREGVQPTIDTYTTIIRCFAKCNFTREGHKIFSAMKNAPIELTETAYGIGMVLYVEGNWYRHAATLLKKLEIDEISLDAAAQASLIRSFGMFESKFTPLVNAVKHSDLEVCKLLTHLFISNSRKENSESELSEPLQEFLEKWKGASLEDTKQIYNAFLDCFWKKGYKEFARELLADARKSCLKYTKPELRETKWVLNVRDLSVGGAKAAISDGLINFDKNKAEEDLKIEIITGDDFKCDIIQDNRYLKRAINNMLQELKSPFVESDDSKLFQARATEVLEWCSQDRVKEAMGLLPG